MNFAVDRDRRVAYTSTCGVRPVIHRFGLATGRHERIRTGGVCGFPLAAHPRGFLLWAASPVSRLGFPSGRPNLRLLDLRRPGPGRLLGPPGAPLDAIAVGPRG